jgi:hypothetical protein
VEYGTSIYFGQVGQAIMLRASNCDRAPERLSSKLHFFMRH